MLFTRVDLREYVPLKQGLRLSLVMFAVCAERSESMFH